MRLHLPPEPLILSDVCRLQMAHPEVDTRSLRIQYRLVRKALPDCLSAQALGLPHAHQGLFETYMRWAEAEMARRGLPLEAGDSMTTTQEPSP